MSRPKFLVLSDGKPNIEWKKFSNAKRDYKRRLSSGDEGVQIWRSYPTVETLLFNDDGKVSGRPIKEYYGGPRLQKAKAPARIQAGEGFIPQFFGQTEEEAEEQK